MEMLNNDFGTLEFSYNDSKVELKYLVFMEKFYAMVKKDSNLVLYFTSNHEETAHVKVLASDNSNILSKEADVRVEIMEQESRIAHVYDHLEMVKNNDYSVYDLSLTAIKCSLV